jgi:restriction system protein
MSWSQFEVLVAETFRRKGFSVEQRGGNGPDGGVDLVLRLGSDAYLVQCKQWKAQQVGVKTVRELFGVMAAERAVGGFVVASGAFTEEARRFAEGRSIELLGTGTVVIDLRDGRQNRRPTSSHLGPRVPQLWSADDSPYCSSG